MADELNAPVSWWADLEDETKGYLQNKGWDKLNEKEAVHEMFKSYRDAEKKLGIPADRVLRMPSQEDTQGWKTLYEKLGVPSTPDQYDFSALRQADGSPPPENFLNTMRESAAANHLTKDAAAKIADSVLKLAEKERLDQSHKATAEVALAHDALRVSWGANFETNKFVADRAAQMMGISTDALNALAAQTSYGTVMESLRKIGVSMGEAALVGNAGMAGGGQNRIMTREQAMARKGELMSDQDWRSRWLKADKDALTEIQNLDRLIVGSPR
jgi:hypothetical protein